MAEGFRDDIRKHMDRVREEGLGPVNPPIFYGANVKLAREIGIPVFTNGDTGELESPAVALSPVDVPAQPTNEDQIAPDARRIQDNTQEG